MLEKTLQRVDRRLPAVVHATSRHMWGGVGQGRAGQSYLGAIHTLASGNALAKGARKILCS